VAHICYLVVGKKIMLEVEVQNEPIRSFIVRSATTKYVVGFGLNEAEAQELTKCILPQSCPNISKEIACLVRKNPELKMFSGGE
jgi:hypothetical protein